MFVPRLLARIEGARIGVGLRLDIEDGIDSTGCSADPEHNCVLI